MDRGGHARRGHEPSNVVAVARLYVGTAPCGKHDQRCVNDVGRARGSQKTACPVCIRLVESDDFATTKESPEIGLARCAADLGDDGSWDQWGEARFQPDSVLSPYPPIVAISGDQDRGVVDDGFHEVRLRLGLTVLSFTGRPADDGLRAAPAETCTFPGPESRCRAA